MICTGDNIIDGVPVTVIRKRVKDIGIRVKSNSTVTLAVRERTPCFKPLMDEWLPGWRERRKALNEKVPTK